MSVIGIIVLDWSLTPSYSKVLSGKYNRYRRGLCSNLLECAAMGMTIINPRYITNLQGLDDRAIRYKDEFHLDAELVIEQLTAEMKFMNEASALEKSIQDISLRQKMEETRAFNENMKRLQVQEEDSLYLH